MKMNKQIMAAALVLGVAVSAQSQDTWSIVAGPTQFVPIGTSGTTTFSFTQTGGGELIQDIYVGVSASSLTSPLTSLTIASVTGSAFVPTITLGTPFSGSEDNGNLNASIYPALPTQAALQEGQTVTVVVDWTVSSAISAENTFATIEVGLTGISDAENAHSTVNAVPEPTQTVAGAMLLGCGGLIFAGRRLFKKQTV